MSGTTSMTMGDKGRVVIPAPIRARHGWTEGTVLIAYDSPQGLVVESYEEALRSIRAQVAGQPSVVDELIAERRAEAERDLAEFS